MSDINELKEEYKKLNPRNKYPQVGMTEQDIIAKIEEFKAKESGQAETEEEMLARIAECESLEELEEFDEENEALSEALFAKRAELKAKEVKTEADKKPSSDKSERVTMLLNVHHDGVEYKKDKKYKLPADIRAIFEAKKFI